MVNIAKVTLWNQKVGSLARDEHSGNIFFEYDPEFSKKGIEPSPLFVPESQRLKNLLNLVIMQRVKVCPEIISSYNFI